MEVNESAELRVLSIARSYQSLTPIIIPKTISLTPTPISLTPTPISPIDMDLGEEFRLESLVIANKHVWLRANTVISPLTQVIEDTQPVASSFTFYFHSTLHLWLRAHCFSPSLSLSHSLTPSLHHFVTHSLTHISPMCTAVPSDPYQEPSDVPLRPCRFFFRAIQVARRDSVNISDTMATRQQER